MTQISPFGSNSASGTPNVGVQQFCGGLVANFTCSADFASQGGSLQVKVVEDDVNGYRFRVPVVSAPTGFVIKDLDNNRIFEFNGIFESISRSTTSTEKAYNVTVASPLKILGAATIITDTYTGYGTSVEGLPRYFSDDGYYNIPDNPDNYLPLGVSKVPSVEFFKTAPLQFGTNNSNLNYTGMWSKQYNLINVFAAFENDSVGIVNFRGFGASASSEDGMTLDRVCYALDYLVNKTASSDAQRYIGGNIVFGTNSYNLCSTAAGYTSPYPYYYGFDAIGFYNQVRPYLTSNYRIKGPLTILEMVSQICDEINAEFIVNLDFVNYTSGDLTSYNNTAYSVYSSGTFQLSKTFNDSILGGIIWTQVVPKNTYVNCNRPFSDIAYNLIGLEVPNFGGYGTDSGVNPGVVVSGYLDPLDDDYTNTGTRGSQPYGGQFPSTSSGNGVLLSDHLNRASDINISIKSNDGVSAKFIVGGYQTRMVSIPRDYIYQYWGDIKIPSTGVGNCSAINRSSDKLLPVVTQILPPNDIVDTIMVDIADIVPRHIDFWDTNYWSPQRISLSYAYTGDVQEALYTYYSGSSGVIIQPIVSGIYLSSCAEIRAAMSDEWEDYMQIVKPEKYAVLKDFFVNYVKYNYSQTLFNYNAFATKPQTLAIKKYTKSKNSTTNNIFSFEKEDLSVKLRFDPPETPDVDDLIETFVQKLKTIGDEHYGRSWYVPVSYFRTKLTENNDNLFGDYERSWDLTSSAYVEPSLFDSIDAPFDSKFIEEGRLKPFVNFEYQMSGGRLGYDIFTDSILGYSESGIPKFDFSEFNPQSVVIDNTGCYNPPLVHAEPESISDKYEFLPCNYFKTYNRYSAPFFELTNVYGSGKVQTLTGAAFAYNTISKTGVMPTGALNNCGTNASLVRSVFDQQSGVTPLDTWSVLKYGHSGYFIQFPTDQNKNTVKNFLNLRFNDNGQNCLPFVRITTNRVYYPKAKDSGVAIEDPNFSAYLSLRYFGVPSGLTQDIIKRHPQTVTNSKGVGSFDLFPPVLPPKSVCVPQISNRYVYGPWMSNYTTLYCGRVEFEVRDELRPENYIIPNYGSLTLSGGTFSSGILSQLSGFAGMNLAGQAIANSIDNFSFFAQEEGSITLPGLPKITKIGQNLLSGPRVTDINVNVEAGSNISTTYNFRQNSPRLGRTNKDVVKVLNKLSKTVTRKKNG